jgi:hypothetical protein
LLVAELSRRGTFREITPTETQAEQLTDCPFCGELIKKSAKKCKHCGEFLDVALRAAMQPHHPPVIHVPQAAPQQVLHISQVVQTKQPNDGCGCGNVRWLRLPARLGPDRSGRISGGGQQFGRENVIVTGWPPGTDRKGLFVPYGVAGQDSGTDSLRRTRLV